MTTPGNDIMDAYSIIFKDLHYLGPGDTEITQSVIKRIIKLLPPDSRIADLGCGVGASTLTIASLMPEAHLLAVDMHEPFLKQLQVSAKVEDVIKRIEVKVGDMAAPPDLNQKKGAFNLIWAESSIYAIGRKPAFKAWYPLLTTEGLLVFSDIVWKGKKNSQSSLAVDFWIGEYPDISRIDQVLKELVEANFQPLEPYVCNQVVWSNYYEPLRRRLDQLALQPNLSSALIQVMEEFRNEIRIYDQTDDVDLVFFIARKK